MTRSLPVVVPTVECWNRIGVQGDRSCPELFAVVHCHNCPVFAVAAKRLLDNSAPPGYLEDAIERLASPSDAAAADLYSVLVFRIGEEWLALSVQVLIEVNTVRPVHSVPHWGGMLAGLVNIRGELQLCIRLDQLLGIKGANDPPRPRSARDAAPVSRSTGLPVHANLARFLVVQSESDRWVFPVDEVDQVHRFPAADLKGVPSTLARSAARLSRGVFPDRGRTIGYLDETRLFQALQSRLVP